MTDLRSELDSKDGLKIWARGNLLAAFFAVTFLFSWGVWLPGVVSGLGLADLSLGPSEYAVLNVVGGFGPSLAAMILAHIGEGWGGVRSLLGSGINVKGVDRKWWLATLLVFPVLNIVSGAANYVGTGGLPETRFPEPFLLLLYPLAFLFPLGNHWREEYGWRGYALPAMQSRYGALYASVALGLAWGLWHLPLFFFPTTQMVYGEVGFVTFMAKAVLLTCIMTWLYNGSGGRLITAMVAHFLAGALDYFVLKTSMRYGQLMYLALELALVAAIVIRYGPDRMAPGGD